jgi:hypothetical protein
MPTYKLPDPHQAIGTILSRTDIDPQTDCWLYRGATTKGYGSIYYNKKLWATHRLSWTLIKGPIPEGLYVLHRCHRPPCWNPAHLFLGGSAENLTTNGYKGGGAKLTWTQVQQIRQRYSPPRVDAEILALEYGVQPQAIHNIISLRTWHPSTRPDPT